MIKKKKLKTIKEEPAAEKEELSKELSKAAEDAMKNNNYEELGKIVKNAETNHVTINANIGNTTDIKRDR